MVKVDDEKDNFKSFGAHPPKEDPFLKAVTKLAKAKGFYGRPKEGISSSKTTLTDSDIARLKAVNKALTAKVEHPEAASSKRPKKTSK